MAVNIHKWWSHDEAAAWHSFIFITKLCYVGGLNMHRG